MTPTFRHALFLALLLGGPLAQAQAPAVAAPASAPIVNLPDFTRLVERAGPAVVNIEASAKGEEEALAQQGRRPPGSQDVPDDVPEFFKRFFEAPGQGGPPGPMPRGGVSQGTGFIISADGYVLTNHHVVAGADDIVVRLADSNELTARLIGSDPLSDVALLKVEGQGLPVLKIADSRSLKPGQWVLAIGSPFGFEHSVTAGIVSGVGRRSLDPSQQYVPFIQTDVAINRGNSGGPLLNTSGEVVGINSQIFSNSGGYMGVSFAIPIEVAMNAVRQLRETGRVVRGQLGVRIQDVGRERMAELGLARPIGAFVDSVENGSAAARAGLRPGDVITAINGREIVRSAELPPLVGAMPPGSRVSLGLLRNGKPLDVVVTLSALDAAVASGPDASPAKTLPAPAAGNPLGVVVESLDAPARQALGLAEGEGVLVSRVAGLAARRAGLAPGDVVLQVGRTSVGTVAQFEGAVKGLKPGDEVRLLVRNTRSTGFVTFVLR
ncbi:Do family serine endopeptidase [Arenimonas sp. MALMAid1274]|uniref:Do family serine endopeptidase n=1 Tax=Arenimonas sp. MALMAid1274 TaxID=3411630 RepID=UPI003B9F6AF1